MANEPCSLAGLVEDSNCYDCLSETEKQAAMVYFWAKVLNALGGTDLTDINTLREYIACYCVPDARLNSFKVAIGQDASVNSGADRSAMTTTELRDAIKCLACGVPAAELRRAEVVLLCLVGQAAITVPV